MNVMGTEQRKRKKSLDKLDASNYNGRQLDASSLDQPAAKEMFA